MFTKIIKAIFIPLTLPALSYGYALESGKIYYHLKFPVSIDGKTENIALSDNYKDLIMSNFVAGAMYSHLINKHFPNLKFNREYIEGSLLSQLLQENLDTNAYRNNTDWINPDPAVRTMLLAPGQGGPYQLNDYSKRLEHNLGMINFSVLQKSLGFTIKDQDSGLQTSRKGPDSLDNKYFGPLAATYFQYNDILRIQKINQDSWGPSAPYFKQCMSNLEKSSDNFLDMIMNAVYNAGPWAEITKTSIELCANVDNPEYANKVKHINDYTLDDSAYQQAIGTKEHTGTTFILYPRQIRYYLDQLYNNPTGLNTKNSLTFPINQLKIIFTNSIATLAYQHDGHYTFIAKKDAENAFDKAASGLSLPLNESLDIGISNQRKQILNLLETSIQNLSSTLKIDFTEVTEKDLGAQ